jgi:uncharacterized protein (TIGR00661 family)
MPPTKIALICPLDWGIGHATRCIPVISALSAKGYKIIVAASGRPLEFILNEYPGLHTIEFQGVKVSYPRHDGMGWKIFRMVPSFLLGIWREHRQLKKIVAETGATLVVSDNRYGCWHKNIKSVFITHQLNIHVPPGISLLQPLLNSVNYWFIRKYDQCWIPDFEPHRGLAGALSHPAKLPSNARYIGILSRFALQPEPIENSQNQHFDLLVMLSGPEPQRTILGEKILRQLSGINMQVAMVCGMPETETAYVLDGRIHVFSHLNSPRLKELIGRSALVVCRSGYSSIMDLVTMGKSAIFIPTPGQPEQEYLARYLMDKKIYFSTGQQEFDLLYALEMSKNYPGMVIRNDHKELEELIAGLSG